MSVAALTLTTLTPQIDKSQTKFLVNATTGITGLGSLTTPQSMIVIDNEAMLVLNVPVAGALEVQRGAMGTKAVPHPAGANVYAGPRTAFAGLENGHITLNGDAGNPAGFLPAYRLPLGTRATASRRTRATPAASRRPTSRSWRRRCPRQRHSSVRWLTPRPPRRRPSTA